MTNRRNGQIKTKPFRISKRAVWKAWLSVKANRGAAGVDDESISDFEEEVKDRLYTIWNRMSSGAYFPPPVRRVAIPKSGGGERKLGIPTVGDRVAQMVVKMYLEPLVEPVFHPDSYGYRPNKSAIEAVGQARQRCWKCDWVIDMDIKGFFDNIDHDLMMRAVRKHTDCKWILLYIERWLKAPVRCEDGTLQQRDTGTPQGGVVSPLLANIFLHHAFDAWMAKEYPYIPFERYADDIVAHCRTKNQAHFILGKIVERLKACKLEVHPGKTKIVYCKDGNRPGKHSNESFDFLGFTFQPRHAKNMRLGTFFVSFLPGASRKAAKQMRAEIRVLRMHRRSRYGLEDLSLLLRAKIQGWINYYGQYYKSALDSVFQWLNRRLVRWVQLTYKRYRLQRRATHWLRRIARREPGLFPHWEFGVYP